MVEGVVDIFPLALVSNTGMQEGKASAGEHKHNTFHDHEQSLVADEEVALETTRELNTAVHTSSEDCYSRDNEANEKGLEETRVNEVGIARVPGTLPAPHVLGEPACGNGEQDQGEDLEAQTSQHDILSRIQEC